MRPEFKQCIPPMAEDKPRFADATEELSADGGNCPIARNWLTTVGTMSSPGVSSPAETDSPLQSLLAEPPQDVQLLLGDRQQVVEVVRPEKRYVMAGGGWLQERDEQRRSACLNKADEDLKRLAGVRRKEVKA